MIVQIERMRDGIRRVESTARPFPPQPYTGTALGGREHSGFADNLQTLL